jgi:hypothetical protein
MDKRQEVIDRLLQLPQQEDVWQLGVEQYLVRWINFAGRGAKALVPSVTSSVASPAAPSSFASWQQPGRRRPG